MGRSSSPFAARPASPGRPRRTPRSGERDQRKTHRLSKPFVATPRSPRIEWEDEAEGSEYPIPTWALQPLHNPEWSDDLKALFKYYATFGDTHQHGGEEGITRANWWKLVRECRMVDANVNSSNTDIVFQECFPRSKRTNGRQRIGYSQFLLGLTVLSQRKYGHADPVGGLLQLVHEHVLPTAYHVQQSFRSAAVCMPPPPVEPETARLFDEMQSTLQGIFDHYTKMGSRSGPSPELSLKQLAKLAEDTCIVPKLLSYAEVTQLGKACLGPDREGLEYHTWLDWLYRAATHGFSKEPFGRLYVSAAEKLEKLFEKIDRAPVCSQIQLAHRGVKHAQSFAKQRQDCAAQAEQVLTKLVQADKTELVALVTHELAALGLTELLESTYEYYCMGSEVGCVEGLKALSFYKLVRDCNLLEAVRHERVDLVFLDCLAGSKEKLRMGYTQFILALSELAKIVTPEAPNLLESTLELIQHSVLTNAKRLQKFEAKLTLRPELQQLLVGHHDLIHAIFSHYHQQDMEGGKVPCASEPTTAQITAHGFLQFAKEFGVAAHIASQQELCVLFRSCRAQSDSLNQADFCELLCRCAIIWCDVDERSEASELVAAVSNFLATLKDAEAMVALESHRARTQTTPRHTLKSPRTPRPAASLPPVPLGLSPANTPRAAAASVGAPQSASSMQCPVWASALFQEPRHDTNLRRIYEHYRTLDTAPGHTSPALLCCSKLYRLFRELDLIGPHADLPQVDATFAQVLGSNFHRYAEISFQAFQSAIALMAADQRSLSRLLLNQVPALVHQLQPAPEPPRLCSPGRALSATECDRILESVFCHYCTRTSYVAPHELWSDPTQISFGPAGHCRLTQRQLMILAHELCVSPNLLPESCVTAPAAGMSLEQFRAWVNHCAAEAFGEAAPGSALVQQMGSSTHLDKIGAAAAGVDLSLGQSTVRSVTHPEQRVAPTVYTGGDALLLGELMAHLDASGQEPHLRQVFRFYCSWAEDCPSNMLCFEQFVRYATDAQLIELSAPHEVTQRVYCHAARSRAHSLGWEGFLVATIELTANKFGVGPDMLATVVDALDGLVLALCSRRAVVLTAQDSDLFMKPELIDVLLQHDALLKQLFKKYAAARPSGALELSPEAMLEMALELGLISGFCTENDLVQMQVLSTGGALVFTQFVELICRVGAHGGRAEAPVEARVRTLLDGIASHPSVQACIPKPATKPAAKPASRPASKPGTPRTPRAASPSPRKALSAGPGSRPQHRAKSAPRVRPRLPSSVQQEAKQELNTVRNRVAAQASSDLSQLEAADLASVKAVFEFYCSYAESQLQTSMRRSNLYKLIRDAQIEGPAIHSSNLGVIISGCQPVGCASARIDLPTFFAMMAQVAAKLFPGHPEPTGMLLQEHLCPLAARIVKAPLMPSAQQSCSAAILELLGQCQDTLDTLFEHYSSLVPPEHRAGSGAANTAASLGLKELTKFAEEFELVPALLSKMEVGRLIRAVNSRGSSERLVLARAGFGDWLARAALHGFSRQEYTEEYPTDEAKVEKLLTMIDNSPLTLSIKQARGKRHVTHFARRHNEALQRHAQQRSANLAKGRCDVERQLLELLENRGLCEEVRRAFEFYCSYGEESVKESLKGFMFYKMVRDCDMLDERLQYERVDLVFHQSLKGAPAGRAGRLGFPQFLGALSMLAQAKFPTLDSSDGFVSLCEDFLIPMARKADQTPPEFGSFQHSTIQALLHERNQLVSLIFSYYAKLDKLSASVRASRPRVSLKNFVKFAKDFGISSCIASHQELARMFHATVGEGEEAGHQHWQEVLCRCAMHWGGLSIGLSSPGEIADRLGKFMHTLENSEAMISIEQWKSRTQTHKKALYRYSD